MRSGSDAFTGRTIPGLDWALSADVAQLVERRLPKPKVAGSRPVVRFARRPRLAPPVEPRVHEVRLRHVPGRLLLAEVGEEPLVVSGVGMPGRGADSAGPARIDLELTQGPVDR